MKQEVKMKLNIKRFRKLMEQKASNNYNEFARQTGINVSLLYKILNGQVNAGTKTISKIVSYLKNQNIDVSKYIFLC